MRVAVVGLGPKGLFALERLLDHAARASDVELSVDVFEPGAPGAGPNYDPRQPDYLRMNFAAGQVDMWADASSAVPGAERLGLVDWSRARGGTVGADDFPPRALVGRYLADGLATVLRHVPRGVSVARRAAPVERVTAQDGRWLVESGGGGGAYDEVVLATGHDWAGTSTVFPVARWLSRSRVPAGSIVAVRGFALTFIDAALALTEGRGGAFGATGHPYRLAYRASGEEPASIVPYSRTGRPMPAKPAPGLAASFPALGEISRRGQAVIRAIPAPLDIDGDLVPALASVAAASLRAAGASSSTAIDDGLALWLVRACNGALPPVHEPPVEELERSLAVGAGLRAPDVQWALGHGWRALYPAIVERVGGDGLTASSWLAFHRLARALERVAFGPAPLNAAKLLALVDAGIVDLAHLRDGGGAADVVLDAVIPGPGARGPLFERLLEDGVARVPRGRRGVEVTADGTCIGRDGRPSAGLAAIGRPTEDSVIGNDTLSRTLHPQADRWARRVVARSIEQARARGRRHALVL
jgi:diaminopimelate decarboxylase